MDGGGTFRARFGVERDGVNLLAEGSYSLGSEIKDGYPEFTDGGAEEARLGQGSHADELAIIEKVPAARQDRYGVVVDRPVRRHPARRDEAWLRALRQRARRA